AGSGAGGAWGKARLGTPAAARFSPARASACVDTSQPWKSEAGKAFAISMSATPVPQPTSATAAPAASRSTSPAMAGSAIGTRSVRNQGAKPRSIACAPSGPNASYGSPIPLRNASGRRSTTAISWGRCAKCPTPQKGEPSSASTATPSADGPAPPPRGRREAAAAAIPQHARRALLVHPLAQPALVQAAASGQLRAGDRLTVCQRTAEPETVSEADHRGGGGAAERAEEAARVGLEAVGIERAAHFFLRRALARATTRARERIASLPVRFFAAAGFAARRGRDAGFFFAFVRALPRARAAARFARLAVRGR